MVKVTFDDGCTADNHLRCVKSLFLIKFNHEQYSRVDVFVFVSPFFSHLMLRTVVGR